MEVIEFLTDESSNVTESTKPGGVSRRGESVLLRELAFGRRPNSEGLDIEMSFGKILLASLFWSNEGTE